MTNGIWHVTFATTGRRPLASDERQRRLIVRTLARVAGRWTVLFCVVDDHLHLVLLCRAQDLGRICAAVYRALAAINPAIKTGEPKPVEDRGHMEALVPYVLTQVWRHEVAGAHPALWSGSCFQDLVGARLLEPLALQITAALPRFRLDSAYAAVRLDRDRPLPLPQRDQVRALGPSRIAGAASAALRVGPQLMGLSAGVVRARRCVVQLGLRAGVPRKEIGWTLGITPRGLRRLAGQPPDLAAQRATLTRLALEEAVPRAAGPPPSFRRSRRRLYDR